MSEFRAIPGARPAPESAVAPRPWTVLVVLLLAAALSACGTGATTTLHSVATSAELTSPMTVLAYWPTDANTADVYMSDLPRAALEPDADLSDASGQLVHLHVFITPEAGSTPIDPAACSVIIRSIVVARGQLGLYGGGAFLNPSSPPGGDRFSGSMNRGTCRLLTNTQGFIDRLGPSEFSATFSVPRDQATSTTLKDRFATMLQTMPVPQAPNLKPTQPATPKAPADK